MAKPQIVEDKDLDLLVKVTLATTGEHGVRNVALIYTLFGTGLMPSEIAALRVNDYLQNGKPKEDTEVRADISFNGRIRPLMWTNKRLVAAIDAYLAERIAKGLGVAPKQVKYRGLDPVSPLFLAKGGDGFTFRVTERGDKTYRSCASLTNLLNKLIAGAGLEGCNTGSARRTLAVKLHRKHVKLRTINEILGQSSLGATRALCQGDTARLSKLVAGVI
ncbi:MAG: hypothetical protein PHQ60_01945 [Sideroxydans sp.]|nr:hypothetical protein [Sideroxydans sp.]MDD5056604.1 hypothetical protein [Sideroxydans sp.]